MWRPHTHFGSVFLPLSYFQIIVNFFYRGTINVLSPPPVGNHNTSSLIGQMQASVVCVAALLCECMFGNLHNQVDKRVSKDRLIKMHFESKVISFCFAVMDCLRSRSQGQMPSVMLSVIWFDTDFSKIRHHILCF